MVWPVAYPGMFKGTDIALMGHGCILIDGRREPLIGNWLIAGRHFFFVCRVCTARFSEARVGRVLIYV